MRKLKRPFAKWEGLAFRAAPLPHARVARLLDGKGSLRIGGRWSAAGTFPAVNLSTAPETAVKESGATFTYYNFAPSDVRPKVLVGVRLSLARILDLVNPRGLRTKPWLGLTELLAEDWRKVNDAGHEAQSQALGRAVQEVGAEGLLAPSARVSTETTFASANGSGSKSNRSPRTVTSPHPRSKRPRRSPPNSSVTPAPSMVIRSSASNRRT